MEGFWPNSLGRYMARAREVPMVGLVGLIAVWNLAPYVVRPVLGTLVQLLYALA